MKKTKGTKRRRRPPGAAATVGEPANTVSPVPSKWYSLWRRLRMLHEHLLAQREGLVRDAEAQVGVAGIHMADVATDEAQRDLDLSLLSAEGDALFEVEEALRRIEGGIYGVCALSGKPIPKTRLQAIPWTRFTAEVETELEKKGLARKAHLGELSRVEVAPETLSRALNDIRPPAQEVSSTILPKLEETAPGGVQELDEAGPPGTSEEDKTEP